MLWEEPADARNVTYIDSIDCNHFLRGKCTALLRMRALRVGDNPVRRVGQQEMKGTKVHNPRAWSVPSQREWPRPWILHSGHEIKAWPEWPALSTIVDHYEA